MIFSAPARVLKSTGLRPAAWTRTSNSPARGDGCGTSVSAVRSGPPYAVRTKARMSKDYLCRDREWRAVLKHPVVTRYAVHAATNSEFANGHFSSIHCACIVNPEAFASSATPCGVYLWLLSVQIVSSTANETVKSQSRTVTDC